jgi:hypothetical protein
VLQTDHPRIDPRALNRAVVDKHIGEYRELLRNDPNSVKAHYGLGVAYFNLGLTEAAIESLEKACSITPENPHIHTQLAVVWREEAQTGDARAIEEMRDHIQDALRLDPENIEALILASEQAGNDHDIESALAYSERAAALEPDRARDLHERNLIRWIEWKVQRGEASRTDIKLCRAVLDTACAAGAILGPGRSPGEHRQLLAGVFYVHDTQRRARSGSQGGPQWLPDRSGYYAGVMLRPRGAHRRCPKRLWREHAVRIDLYCAVVPPLRPFLPRLEDPSRERSIFMTQLRSTTHPDVMLDTLLRTAKDRSARGNATRRDWQRVAEIDPELARRELRDFLRRTQNGANNPANPYERGSRKPGALIGFLIGCAVMIALWIFLPYARSNWMETGVMRDIATGGQFVSTLFVPLGTWLGARWGRHAHAEQANDPVGLPKNASFDEMLDAFERTQHVGRARVY